MRILWSTGYIEEENMLTFEVINELTLKVTCEGSDTLITKAGAFIAGENPGGKNYSFESEYAW